MKYNFFVWFPQTSNSCVIYDGEKNCDLVILKGNHDFGVYYKKGEICDLVIFTYIDYVGYLYHRKNNMWFYVHALNKLISWYIKNQLNINLLPSTI